MTNAKQLIENILANYRLQLGKDFDRYRNHVHRVFALCRKLDDSKQNEAKYAIAAAFHDLGIWTHNTFDYLKPSIAMAEDHLQELGRMDWRNEVTLMIDMHHKRSKYKGDFEKVVETFRRADWIDVTKGYKLFGLPSAEYTEIKNHYPTLGFHRFLVKQTIKQLFITPMNPLPMFKK